jgi:hypothetical protein
VSRGCFPEVRMGLFVVGVDLAASEMLVELEDIESLKKFL